MSDGGHYDWQKKTFLLWAHNGYRGVVKAVTGSGKSYAALDCMIHYRDFYPEDTIWVVCDYNELKSQWRQLLDEHGFSDVPVYLYMAALSEMRKNTPDCVILDEAHHLESNTWGKVADFGIPHILALSATPNTSCAKVGKIIQQVGFDQAYIAPSVSHLVEFPLKNEEREQYDKRTLSMQNYKKSHPSATYRSDFIYMKLINMRKAVCASFPLRYELGLEIVKRNHGRRMMLFFTKQREVKSFAQMLDSAGIDDYAMQISSCKQIDQFKCGFKSILLSINMVATGFSDPTVEVGVMFTYPFSPRDAIQKVGRILRPKEGKTADIYYIVAEGTADTEVISNRNALFPPNSTVIEKAKDYGFPN